MVAVEELLDRAAGDEDAPSESQVGELAAGDQLVGEGAGDADELGCLPDRDGKSGSVIGHVAPPVIGRTRRHSEERSWRTTVASKVATEVATGGKSGLPGVEDEAITAVPLERLDVGLG